MGTFKESNTCLEAELDRDPRATIRLLKERLLQEELQIFADGVRRRVKLTKERANQEYRVIDSRKGVSDRTNHLMYAIGAEFDRINHITKSGIRLDMKIIENKLWVSFSRGTEKRSVTIPLPKITDNGLELLVSSDVVRVLCDHWLEQKQKRLNYHEVIETLFCEDVNMIKPSMWSGSPMIHKIVKSFDKKRVAYMVSNMQRLINDIVNIMPLYETDMNTWAMNHRLIVIDSEFDGIVDPNHKLEYQVQKNLKYHKKYGWTSIGLSDGVLADKNYLLTTDLRLLTPFSQYHNPQRNLYSTLCMKGDELPNVRSTSMQKLIDRGINRKGWNLVTAVVDTPMNFEDQILVDKRHLGLYHSVEKRFVIYGDKLLIKKGETIRTDDKLGYSTDGHAVTMNMRCDSAYIHSIRKDMVDLNGEEIPVFVVVVKGKRFLRDGSKFSNLHGNKGVIRFLDLGYAIDARNGDSVPIDVMISGTSINKRKNFSQILEALANNVRVDPLGKIMVDKGLITEDQLNAALSDQKSSKERKRIGQIVVAKYGISSHQIQAALDEQKLKDKPIVVKDDIIVEKSDLASALKKRGFPEDGTSMVHTYCGEVQAIVGKIFWGVTKDSEDQVWDNKRTEVTNNRELRTSGLKFSHVEIKALTTRFGVGNPIVKEILSYSQGVEVLSDELKIIRSARGEIDSGVPVVDAADVKCVDNTSGIFHTIDAIKGTVVDDEYMPEGFALRLPCYFQAIIDRDDLDNFVMGLPQPVQRSLGKIEYTYNTIYIPNALIRRCWRHPSGKWGLNTTGAQINHIVASCHRFTETGDVNDEIEVMRAVARYFLSVTRMMGSKTGELGRYGMSVRYPFSSRGTAVLAEDLPKNTVEIHDSMAKALKVKSGDVILIERFPCLGFMSIVPQYVRVSDDPQCKYVVRVSGNSLVCEDLDFDGDTLFPASFHTPAAIEALRKEMVNPNPLCDAAIKQSNSRKIPCYKQMGLDDFQIQRFPKPNNEDHAELVRKATGVKSHTGPVIALAYNLMRIVEKNVPYENLKEHVNLELLLNFLGNTVFKQKHGIRSLQEEATDAICTADVDKMVELGFDRAPSKLLCDLIRKEAASLRVYNLVKYHDFVKENGGSKIINFIVRRKNRVYFATRANLGPFKLLDHLNDAPVDLPSWMLSHILRSTKEDIEAKLERLKAEKMNIRDLLTTDSMREVYHILSAYIDDIMIKGTISSSK